MEAKVTEQTDFLDLKVARDSVGLNKIVPIFCKNLLFMAQAVGK